MRKLLLLLSLVALGVAHAAPDPVSLNTNTRFEFTDCASGGSASQSLTAGTYLMRVTGEDVNVCYAATCVTGGEKYPVGTVMLLRVGSAGNNPANVTTSCRSANSAGDVIFTAGG